MRERVLFTETTSKLSTRLVYVLFVVLFSPLHFKQVVRPVRVSFPEMFLQGKRAIIGSLCIPMHRRTPQKGSRLSDILVLLQYGNITEGPLPSSALARDGAGKSNLRVKVVGQVEAFQADKQLAELGG